MPLQPIGSDFSGLLPVPSGTAGSSPLSGTPTSRAGSIPFGEVVSNFLRETNDHQQNIGVEVQRLVSGESENVHDVVLSVAKADLSFRMVMEIRNQLISSYQEIMRMQV